MAQCNYRIPLKSAQAMLDVIGAQLPTCGERCSNNCKAVQVHGGEPTKGKKRGQVRDAPKLALRTQLFQMRGADLTRIDGIDVTTALAVTPKTGADMLRSPMAGHVAIRRGLCTSTKITRGKARYGG